MIAIDEQVRDTKICSLSLRVLSASVFFLLLSFPLFSQAEVRVDVLPEQDVVGEFVVGPGKIELTMRPGEERTVEVRVSNRMGMSRIFRLGTEDFIGSSDPKQTVQLLGSDRGPYSLRNFLFPEVSELVVDHATRVTIPIRVAIPDDAEPGGLYGSVLVSTESIPGETDSALGARSGAAIVSRIGVLFFVRIAGAVEESGELTSFATKDHQLWYTHGPIPLEIAYTNNGSVHLNPYGRLYITNIAGQMIGEQIIDPWFVMPGSTRIREVGWNRSMLFGRYTAHLELNRGYGDIVDEVSYSFWVIPIKAVALLLLGLCILFFILRFLATRIEIRVK